MAKAFDRTKPVLFAVILLAATLVAYIPAMRGGFVWDDDEYVSNNRALRSWTGLRDIWLRPAASPQYYPLVFTTYWLEGCAWGHQGLDRPLADNEAFGYHLTNVLLHGLAAVVLWRLLRRLGLAGSWLAAMIFALHPVNVESVAWITERKNVLSGLLYFLSLSMCVRFWGLEAEPASPARPKRGAAAEGKMASWGCYGAALALFVAALLSKTVTATLPVVVLLLIWWKRDLFTWAEAKRALLLVPFFFIGAATGLHTAWLEKQHVGATGWEWALTLVERVLLAGRALWFYAAKLLWPTNLTFIYPRWQISQAIWWQYLFPLAAAGVVAVLFLVRRRVGKGPLAAVLFFILTLSPALGFFNVYPMRFSFVADHFQYLAGIGLIVVFAQAAWVASTRLHSQWRRHIAHAGIAGLLVLLGGLTWHQGRTYRDLEGLWLDTLGKNPRCFLAYNNLGVIYSNRHLTYAEVNHYQKALDLNPGYTEAHYNLANALDDLGDFQGALSHYGTAIQQKPTFSQAHNNMAILLDKLDRRQEAIDHWREAIRLRPQDALYHANLAEALLLTKQYQEAADHSGETLRSEPNNAFAHYILGSARLALGQREPGIAHLKEAFRLDPSYLKANQRLMSATRPEAKATTSPSRTVKSARP